MIFHPCQYYLFTGDYSLTLNNANYLKLEIGTFFPKKHRQDHFANLSAMR